MGQVSGFANGLKKEHIDSRVTPSQAVSLQEFRSSISATDNRSSADSQE